MQKAVVYVAVPLFVELCLLAAVTYFLYQSEAEAARVEHAKAVIAKSEDVVQLLYDVGVAYVVYDARSFPMFEERFTNVMQRIPAKFDELAELVKTEPQQMEKVENARVRTKKALAVLGMRKAQIAQGGHLDIWEAIGLRGELDRIVSELNGVIAEARRAQQRDPEASKRFKTIAEALLLCGGVIAVVALYVVAVFMAHTTRRLNVLMDNSARLGVGAQLAEPLSGNDEIAQIDRVFHNAVDELRELEQFKEQLISMVSHDIRTPLTAVKSTLEALSAGLYGRLEEKAITKTQRAERNLNHTIELINSLLDLQKFTAVSRFDLKIKPTLVQQVLQNSVSVVGSLAESRDVEIVTPSADAVLDMDEQLILQVMINLLGNALKFSPRASTVRIDFELHSDCAKFLVIDQGPGVSPSYRDKIFQPYQQLESTRRKSVEVLVGARAMTTGLGLSICKSIIEAHGGKIGVDPATGGGSAFWFTIPQNTETKEPHR